MDDRPFAEDDLSGALVQLGGEAQLSLLERIPRCRMVSLDPETASPDASILHWLAKTHAGRAGIYARTHHPGSIRVGDPVHILRQPASG